MPLCDCDGRRIYYEVHGDSSAPPLLLIMGLAVSSRAWDRLPARLATRFRVIAFDNCGTGRSLPPAPLYSMRQLADDAAAVLRANALDHQGAFVFGISMGGMIAQELTLRHPQLVRSLALGCTFASWIGGDWPSVKITFDLLNAGFRRARSSLDPAKRILFSDEFTRDNGRECERWMGVIEPCGVLNMMAQMGAIVQHSTAARLQRIAVPTLILSGDADRLIPVANAHRLARLIPGARLHILPGAGHVFPLECEDETVRALEGHFLTAN
jgi:pimeloyl-ACP methyl ester carboxylesterase